MIKIKNLAFLNKNRLKTLWCFVEPEFSFSVSDCFPLNFINALLPFKLKFLDETFASIEEGKINGLITVGKTGDYRVKIKKLLLDDNAFEVGKILVNYLVSGYFSNGVEGFYVFADKYNTPLITMFKEGCSFQTVAFECVYKINSKKENTSFEFAFERIRKMKIGDFEKVKTLAEDTLNDYKKPYFLKTPHEHKQDFVKNKEKYVFLDDNGQIIGYFYILKLNKKDFLLDFVINKGYAVYSTNIVNFAIYHLNKKGGFENLFVKLKSYYSNFEELNEIFKIEYPQIQENEILFKGILVPKKQEFKYEKIILNDITPAF